MKITFKCRLYGAAKRHIVCRSWETALRRWWRQYDGNRADMKLRGKLLIHAVICSITFGCQLEYNEKLIPKIQGGTEAGCCRLMLYLQDCTMVKDLRVDGFPLLPPPMPQDGPYSKSTFKHLDEYLTSVGFNPAPWTERSGSPLA